MSGEERAVSIGRLEVVKAQREEPVFRAGDAVRISMRFPIGLFRVPRTTFVASVAGSSPSSSLPPSTMKRKTAARRAHVLDIRLTRQNFEGGTT
jgi:hypothetical protein